MNKRILGNLLLGGGLLLPCQQMVAAAAAVAADAADAAGTTAAKHPTNVVLILIDDMGWKDLGCMGSNYFQTPHIDQLAAEGAIFTHAYSTSPVSSPARGALYTGKYPARTGFTAVYKINSTEDKEIWHPYSKVEVDGKNSQSLEAMNLHVLPLKEYTFAEAFRDAGYKTGFLGKWHCGWHDNFAPDRQGFDYAEGYRTIPSYTGGHFGKHYVNKVKGLEGLTPEDYMADVLTDKAVDYIKANKENPFLLVLSHFAVHAPCEGKADLVRKYEQLKGDDQNYPVYAAMVESVDQSVERVMRTLKECGIDDNTLVVFTSDNGGLSDIKKENRIGNTSNYPLLGGKSTAYEAGVRIPMIVRWPGRVKPKTKVDVPVILTDLYPTFLDAAQQKMHPEQHKDGISLMPILDGKSMPERPLFFHFPHYTSFTSPYTAVVENGWKLIRFYNDAAGRYQLFNLTVDPYEQNDLQAQYPEKVKAMDAKITKWCKEVDAKLPRKNPKYSKDLPATSTKEHAYEKATSVRERCKELSNDAMK